jgi:glycosyltransferase involved in cell wall biosynthesis
LYRWIERQYLQTVDAFIYNSQTTRHVVEDVLRASPPHVVAVPSGSRFAGMSSASIAQRAGEDRPLRVIFVANLIPRKGLHTLLHAVARLPAEAAQLTVVGDTTTDVAYVRAIRQQIGSLNLEAQVELTGKLPRAALGERLAAADVLAVPSQYEGFGIVYLEGMAFGLPAIATTSGAAREIITSETDGFLIPPEDAGAFASRLLALASDRELLRKMSLAARRRFDAHPTWDDTTARIETFLTGITA